jgi:hypothetical protein
LATAPEVQWLSPFTLPLCPPSGDTPEATLARSAIPKKLTIRFEAHRASVYGKPAAGKTAAFASAAKNLVRESHAMNFIHKLVHPKILDEEILDYQKLLDDMGVEPSPLTLPASQLWHLPTLPLDKNAPEQLRPMARGT